MGDYDYEVQEKCCPARPEGRRQAAADATTLHQEAATDYTQANAVDQMGAGNEGQVLRADRRRARAPGGRTSTTRAGHLQHSAELERQAADILRERDTANAGANAAEIHAEGAQVVMDFVDLNEAGQDALAAEAGRGDR